MATISTNEIPIANTSLLYQWYKKIYHGKISTTRSILIILCISVSLFTLLSFMENAELLKVSTNQEYQQSFRSIPNENIIETTTNVQEIETKHENQVHTENQVVSTLNIVTTTRDSRFMYDKGIILCLHNGIANMGASMIRELRCLGNEEIIQVYHCFPDEMSPETRDKLTWNDPKVQIIDVCTFMVENKRITTKLAKKFRNYWIKPLALYHTNIAEVILIDADVLAMRDPAIVRSMPGYVKTGTMFFYDRVIKKERNFNKRFRITREKQTSYLKAWIAKFDYKKYGLEGPVYSEQLLQSFAYQEKTAHEQDSSMVVVDKRRAGKAMDVLWYMMTHKRFKVRFSWGDKEAFWLSWELSHTPYTFSPWGIAAVESTAFQDMKDHPDTLCGNMAHYLPMPDENNENGPELLYVNAKSILQPYPEGVESVLLSNKHTNVYNYNPTHITPRQPRREVIKVEGKPVNDECLIGLGATALPQVFYRRLMRRRDHLFAFSTNFFEPLAKCGATDRLVEEQYNQR